MRAAGRWIAAALLGLALEAGCARKAELPVLGTVPDFTLTAQDGNAFNGVSLRGSVWVADFIYTNCPGPCPMMTTRMRRLQQKMAGESRLRLVSFSVDPKRDTPAALTAYARRFGADTGSWTFLTGDAKTLQRLDRDVFHLGDLTPTFDHSTRFVVVDAESRIRGYYAFGDSEMLDRVASAARELIREAR